NGCPYAMRASPRIRLKKSNRADRSHVTHTSYCNASDNETDLHVEGCLCPLRAGLHEWQRQALLILILPLFVRVTRPADGFRLQKQDLGDALAGVDLRGQRRRVADFD